MQPLTRLSRAGSRFWMLFMLAGSGVAVFLAIEDSTYDVLFALALGVIIVGDELRTQRWVTRYIDGLPTGPVVGLYGETVLHLEQILRHLAARAGRTPPRLVRLNLGKFQRGLNLLTVDDTICVEPLLLREIRDGQISETDLWSLAAHEMGHCLHPLTSPLLLVRSAGRTACWLLGLAVLDRAFHLWWWGSGTLIQLLAVSAAAVLFRPFYTSGVALLKASDELEADRVAVSLGITPTQLGASLIALERQALTLCLDLDATPKSRQRVLADLSALDRLPAKISSLPVTSAQSSTLPAPTLRSRSHTLWVRVRAQLTAYLAGYVADHPPILDRAALLSPNLLSETVVTPPVYRDETI